MLERGVGPLVDVGERCPEQFASGDPHPAVECRRAGAARWCVGSLPRRPAPRWRPGRRVPRRPGRRRPLRRGRAAGNGSTGRGCGTTRAGARGHPRARAPGARTRSLRGSRCRTSRDPAPRPRAPARRPATEGALVAECRRPRGQTRRPGTLTPGQRACVVDVDAAVDGDPLATSRPSSELGQRHPAGKCLSPADDAVLLIEDLSEFVSGHPRQDGEARRSSRGSPVSLWRAACCSASSRQ